MVLFLLVVMALFPLPNFMCRMFLLYLNITCNSFLLARLLIMVVVSFLILMLVLSMIVAPGPWLVLVIGFVIHVVSGSLTGSIFLQFPLRAARLLLLMPLFVLPLPPPVLLNGIIV
jgi:hypothetical protein